MRNSFDPDDFDPSEEQNELMFEKSLDELIEAVDDESADADDSIDLSDEDFSSIEAEDDNPETFVPSGDFVSIGPSLKEETFRLMKLAHIDDDFFTRGTLDDRFFIYKSILDLPDLSPDSAEYKFAKQAPIYDLFYFAWKIIHKRFPRDAYWKCKADLEMVFSESILQNITSFDPEKGSASSFFGRVIFGDVFGYLNANGVLTSRPIEAHDARAIKYMKYFQRLFESAGFKTVTEGDFSLEMHNTFQENNHLGRNRLKALISLLHGKKDISTEQIENFDEVYVGDTDGKSFMADPLKTVIKSTSQEYIENAIIAAAGNENDGRAFIRYYYRPNGESRISIKSITELYYQNQCSPDKVQSIFNKIMFALKEDADFLELVGKGLHSDRDIDQGFISESEDLNNFDF